MPRARPPSAQRRPADAVRRLGTTPPARSSRARRPRSRAAGGTRPPGAARRRSRVPRGSRTRCRWRTGSPIRGSAASRSTAARPPCRAARERSSRPRRPRPEGTRGARCAARRRGLVRLDDLLGGEAEEQGHPDVVDGELPRVRELRVAERERVRPDEGSNGAQRRDVTGYPSFFWPVDARRRSAGCAWLVRPALSLMLGGLRLIADLFVALRDQREDERIGLARLLQDPRWPL